MVFESKFQYGFKKYKTPVCKAVYYVRGLVAFFSCPVLQKGLC